MLLVFVFVICFHQFIKFSGGILNGMYLKNPEAFKVFLEACMEEINLWVRCGGNLRSDSWNRVIQKLKKSEFKIEIGQKYLKNLWDYNKKYKIWSDVVNKFGHRYNHETNTFDWPESIWDDYIKI